MRHRVRLLGLLLVLCGSASAEAATVTKIYGTITTLISTAGPRAGKSPGRPPAIRTPIAN